MRLETADGRWRLEVDGTIGTAARVVGAIDARLDGAWSAAQLAGAVTVTCDDLARCARLVDAWRDTARSLPLDGRVTADLELDGTLGRPRVTGTLATPSLTIGPLAATDVHGARRGRPDRVPHRRCPARSWRQRAEGSRAGQLAGRRGRRGRLWRRWPTSPPSHRSSRTSGPRLDGGESRRRLAERSTGCRPTRR